MVQASVCEIMNDAGTHIYDSYRHVYVCETVSDTGMQYCACVLLMIITTMAKGPKSTMKDKT